MFKWVFFVLDSRLFFFSQFQWYKFGQRVGLLCEVMYNFQDWGQFGLSVLRGGDFQWVKKLGVERGKMKLE